MSGDQQTWLVTRHVVARRTLEELDDHLEALSTAECLDYLSAGGLGRVGFAVAGTAIMLPVIYAMLGEHEIVFLTSSGSKLRAIEEGSVLTFEIDHLGDDGIGWSVLATGPARATTDPTVMEAVQELGVRPKAPGRKDHVVGIDVRFVTGRRFGAPPSFGRALHAREP